MDRWAALYELGRRQGNALAVSQAPSVGLTESGLCHRATREAWARPQPRVVLLPGATDDWFTAASSALLSVGAPSALMGAAAARLLGLVDEDPQVIDVLVPYQRGGLVLREPATLRRTRRWERVPLLTRRGLAVVDHGWAAVDLFADLSMDRAAGLVIDAVQSRRLSTRAVQRALDLRPRTRGVAAARALVGDLDAGVQSAFERRLLPLLRRRGLPDPVPQLPVRGRDGRVVHLDLGWGRGEVGLEAVGWRFHRTRRQLQADTLRLNTLRGCPTRIVWVEWTQMITDPGAIVDEVAVELRHVGLV